MEPPIFLYFLKAVFFVVKITLFGVLCDFDGAFSIFWRPVQVWRAHEHFHRPFNSLTRPFKGASFSGSRSLCAEWLTFDAKRRQKVRKAERIVN